MKAPAVAVTRRAQMSEATMSDTSDDPAPTSPLSCRRSRRSASASRAISPAADARARRAIEQAAEDGPSEARDVLAPRRRRSPAGAGRRRASASRRRDDALLLTATAAARLLGVSVDTLRRWAADGALPLVRLPRGGYRYARPDLEALMESAEPMPVRRRTQRPLAHRLPDRRPALPRDAPRQPRRTRQARR